MNSRICPDPLTLLIKINFRNWTTALTVKKIVIEHTSVDAFSIHLQIFGRSENVLGCLTVNTISLNSQVYNHARLRAVYEQ